MSVRINKVSVSGNIKSAIIPIVYKFNSLPSAKFVNSLASATNGTRNFKSAMSSDNNSIFVVYSAYPSVTGTGQTFSDHVGVVKLNKSTLAIEARTTINHSTISNSTYCNDITVAGGYVNLGLVSDQNPGATGAGNSTLAGILQLNETNLSVAHKRMISGASTSVDTHVFALERHASGGSNIAALVSNGNVHGHVQYPIADVSAGGAPPVWSLNESPRSSFVGNTVEAHVAGTVIFPAAGSVEKKPIVWPISRNYTYNDARNTPRVFSYPGSTDTYFYKIIRSGSIYFGAGPWWNGTAWEGIFSKFSFTNDLSSSSAITHSKSWRVPFIVQVQCSVGTYCYAVVTVGSETALVKYEVDTFNPVEMVSIEGVLVSQVIHDGTKLYIVGRNSNSEVFIISASDLSDFDVDVIDLGHSQHVPTYSTDVNSIIPHTSITPTITTRAVIESAGSSFTHPATTYTLGTDNVKASFTKHDLIP